MAFPEFQTKEVLNKVLNSGGDALKVDIDNVTLKTEGSDITIEVHTDKAEDSMLVFSNTTKDGSGTSYVPLVDSDGHLQLDVLTSALPSGAATASNQSTIIGHVDGIETLIGSTNTKLDTLEATADALETLLTGIDADTNAIRIDADAIETLITSTNSKIDLFDAVLDNILIKNTEIDSVLDTIKTDTQEIEEAVETIEGAVSGGQMQVDIVADGAGLATDANLSKMLYGTALAVDISSGDHSLGATYEAFFIGVGGDISLDCATSGSNIVFKNVASGQLLPIRATAVNQTSTTATDIVALKA